MVETPRRTQSMFECVCCCQEGSNLHQLLARWKHDHVSFKSSWFLSCRCFTLCLCKLASSLQTQTHLRWRKVRSQRPALDILGSRVDRKCNVRVREDLFSALWMRWWERTQTSALCVFAGKSAASQQTQNRSDLPVGCVLWALASGRTRPLQKRGEMIEKKESLLYQMTNSSRFHEKKKKNWIIWSFCDH